MKDIKLLVMDVDGTLTDGKLYIGKKGEMIKSFNVKDGYGISKLLPFYSIIPVIITGRSSKILKRRCLELNISHLYQNIDNKKKQMKYLLKCMSLSYADVAYIGDDLNDLECIKCSGITACPADACDIIKKEVDFICSKKGGCGAVREFIEYLIDNNWIKE